MVPLGAVMDLKDITGPDRINRYNLYQAAEINGTAAPGVSSGQAIERMETLARQVHMLLLAFGRGRPRRPLPLRVPVGWLAIATVFLVGFRIGLNVTDSNARIWSSVRPVDSQRRIAVETTAFSSSTVRTRVLMFDCTTVAMSPSSK